MNNQWEKKFLNTFFVSRLGGDHVGAQNDAIEMIHEILRQDRERIQKELIEKINGLKIKGDRMGGLAIKEVEYIIHETLSTKE